MITPRLDPFAASLEPTAEIWSRLARPFDVGRTVEALVGLPADRVERLTGVLVATCPEAETLLSTMPRTLRNLKTAIGTNHQRCIGEMRGPVQWSASIAAQASSLGNKDVYVCASPRRAFDIDENQVLVAALRSVADAGRRIDQGSGDDFDDERVHRARRNAHQASRYLDHRTLEQVDLVGQPTRRALKRTRRSKNNTAYRPALAMLDRMAEPLPLEEITPFCDRRTRIGHGLLLAVIEELEERGFRMPLVRAESGSLFAGPVEFIHPRRRGADSRVHGVLIGNLLVDVPSDLDDDDRERATDELEARSHGRSVVAVLDGSDIGEVVDRAIVAARR